MLESSLGYVFCNVSVMPVRTEPAHPAEQSTQLLFGERAQLLETNPRGWARIRSRWDGYEGWCRHSQLSPMNKKEFMRPPKFLAATHACKIITPSGDLWLPLGSEVNSLRRRDAPKEASGKFKGKKLKPASRALTPEAFSEAALQYINAPYQWGGRSIAGIDCSGLVQMALKLCNHPFPRDASQQVNEGAVVAFLQDARCGDLAFFDNKDGKIVHVGVLLDNETIVHATDTSGHVVADRIDSGGIISRSLRKRTHNLRVVKRILPG